MVNELAPFHLFCRVELTTKLPPFLLSFGLLGSRNSPVKGRPEGRGQQSFH
jgi:hypothetical protein